MTTFILNTFLAIAWAALTGQFTPINIGFGFALGYCISWLLKLVPPGPPILGGEAPLILFKGLVRFGLCFGDRISVDIYLCGSL